MHRLLKRQIKRNLTPEIAASSDIQEFLNSIDQAYKNFDSDYKQLERTHEVSQRESFRELSNFRHAINTSSIVSITDHKGKILFVNKNHIRISGYKEDELIGNSHSTLKSNYHDENFYELLWETIDKGQVWKGEICNKSKQGNLYWIDAVIVPLLNEAGVPYQYISISKDITKIKNAELEIRQYAKNLEKKNAELDQFAYVVSHDLKAPLRAINNLSEWIEEDIVDKIEDETLQNLKLLRGRVHRMENLINGILEYSRVGRKEISMGVVDVTQLVDDLLNPNVLCESFSLDIPNNLPRFVTKKVAFEQVFSNLISNALKYNNPENPYVKIEFFEDLSFYTFKITDKGKGIEKQYHDKIFGIFQTLQSRDKIESTGIGLAIVKRIIEDVNGSIKIESEPGKGSSFIFTWPKEIKS